MAFLKETKCKLVDFSSGSVRFTGHQHRFDYEMILGLQGQIGIQLDKSRYFHIGPGDFILIPPDTFHWMWMEKSPGRYFNYLIQGDLESLAFLAEKGPFALPSLSSYLDPLEKKLATKREGFEQLEDEFFFLWTTGLLERIVVNEYYTHSLTIPTDGGFEIRIRRIMADLIADNPAVRLGCDDLAELIGFERSYLSRKIKNYTGRSLMELYYEELFLIAKSYLKSGASVKEGAYHFGFASPYHFSRKFKQITGVSPSACKTEPP